VSNWTIRRPGRERPDGPVGWIYARLFPIVIGAALGAGLGYVFPLIAYTQTRRHMRYRETPAYDLEEAAERAVRDASRDAEEAVHDAAYEELRTGAKEGAMRARKRAAIGAGLGVLAACGLMFVSAARGKNQD